MKSASADAASRYRPGIHRYFFACRASGIPESRVLRTCRWWALRSLRSNHWIHQRFRHNLHADHINHQASQLLRFRTLTAEDQHKLWHWLHIALWDPPPAGPRPIEILQNPGVSIYAEGWGRPTDVGVVAQVEGHDAGACWVRLLPAGIGLASMDAQTPQLGIALEPAFQRKGHGQPLMLEALQAVRRAGYKRVSLTVHPENPAQFMYERCGFRKMGLRNTYHLMVADVA